MMNELNKINEKLNEAIQMLNSIHADKQEIINKIDNIDRLISK